LSRDPTDRFSGERAMPLDRILGSSSEAGTQRRVRPSVLILLVLLLIRAQYAQATDEVVSVAVIPAWDDSDTGDGDNISPLNAGDIDQPGGRPILTRLGLNGSIKPSHMQGFEQSRSLSDVITRAPPDCSSRMHSLVVLPFVASSGASILRGMAMARRAGLRRSLPSSAHTPRRSGSQGRQ